MSEVFILIFLSINLGREKIVSLFIEHGANVNVQSNEGATPLHFANAKLWSTALGKNLYLQLMIINTNQFNYPYPLKRN